ncbi:cyclase family protein [Paludibaculum fermentans]|uniref:Cyclase family protein n=1 Tax=Paludibaculum fermentans TaxID=1473598 RepID=A0A7S7SL64_PALFE|nr:cyclase family protein [Paludibaculum fermentans]QOY88493.1 cyclase family protein [Paludibaculum fermentans]
MRNALVVLLLFSLGLQAQTRPATTADFERWMKELSNWGRWGKSDESGTLNLITPASRLAAARLVREGVAVSLSHDADKEKAPDNAKPFVHEMITTSEQPGADIFRDSFSIVHHGIMHTHLDALCHFSYKGSSYNGFSTKEVTSKGAARLSIEAARNGLFARGILIDVPELKGVPYLEPGAAIFPEDLDAWEKKTGLRVKPGDVVLIRTGRWARRVEKGPWSMAERAGLHASSVAWLHKRDIAVLGSDASADVWPSQVEGIQQPVHTLVIVAMGTPILDNVDLEELSRESRKRKRWDFLLTAAPLTVPGATGSALNPIAIF